MINPNPETIGGLLNSPIHLQVPKYQREYKWSINEAGEFWEDIQGYAESKSGNLFLGTLIFDVQDSKLKKIVKIVDGQQRLTTILLLLIACRDLAKKINSTSIAHVTQNKISFMDETTGLTGGCRLLSSESIKDVFEFISNYEWDGIFPERINGKQVKRQANRIRPIFDYFSKKIRAYDQTALSNLLGAIYKSYVVRIDIEDEDEAFKIFERTNARGLDLEASDLLKNYLFSQAGVAVEDYWYRIIEFSEGTVLRMLKYYYVSKNGYINKSELYRKLRTYGREIGPLKLVQDLEEFASFYKAIRSADEPTFRNYFETIGLTALIEDQEKFQQVYFSIEGLRLFKITQIYPLISAALNCYIQSGHGEDKNYSKKLIKFFTVLENYHFINNAVCERIGNEVEKLYADFSKTYAESDNFDEITLNFYKAIRSQTAAKEEFVSRFIDITYQPNTIPLISYIFDRINNKNLFAGHRVRIFNPDEKTLRKNHNIEHFYPKNPKEEDKLPHLTSEELDNIGNLLAISFRTNSSLSNLTPKQKLDKLNNGLIKDIQNLDYVRRFLDDYKDDVETWNKVVINKRARSLADNAYDSIWNIAI